jgi:hypothetical protein
MQLEFRKVHSHYSGDPKDPTEVFSIEYRNDNGDWKDLDTFNEKVTTIIVDALNNYQKQNQEQLTLRWSEALNNDSEQS